MYRFIAFKRREIVGEFEVVRLEYDPNRTARIALIKATGDLGPVRLSTAAEMDTSYTFEYVFVFTYFVFISNIYIFSSIWIFSTKHFQPFRLFFVSNSKIREY